jgi:putative addiction module component (TIGR02574 family)
MSTPILFPPPGFDELSTDEKIHFLALLWDRITTRSATLDVPDWHREVIAERLPHLDLDPNSGDQWDAVQKRVRERLGKQR